MKTATADKPEVVLIFPKTIEIDFISVDIPYSTFFVGSYVQACGYPVKLFDQRKTSMNSILDYVKENKVGYVGISTMTGPQLLFSEEFSREIKAINPDTVVFWGGVHPTIAPETVLELDVVDYVLRGEGEETCVSFLDSLTSGGDISDVNGVSWKDDDGRFVHNPDRPFMDVDDVSLDWDLIDGEQYIIPRGKGLPSLAFITSRGCPFRCQFCWDVIVHDRKFRYWSYDHLIEELEKLKRFDIDYIEFMDDNIGSVKNHLFRVCDYLKENDIRWFSSLRSDFLTRPGVIENLHNLDNCYIGVESGSQRILDLIKKDQKAESITEAAIVLKQHGTTGNFSWIIGLPDETPEDLNMTLEMVDKVHEIQPNAPQRLRVYSPYSGAPLYEKAVEMGYTRPETLFDWAKLSRENCELDYIVDKWQLKTISYASYFKFYMDTAHVLKPIYYLPSRILKFIANLRWKHKFFKIPVEIYAVELYRKLASNPLKKWLYSMNKKRVSSQSASQPHPLEKVKRDSPANTLSLPAQ